MRPGAAGLATQFGEACRRRVAQATVRPVVIVIHPPMVESAQWAVQNLLDKPQTRSRLRSYYAKEQRISMKNSLTKNNSSDGRTLPLLVSLSWIDRKRVNSSWLQICVDFLGFILVSSTYGWTDIT